MSHTWHGYRANRRERAALKASLPRCYRKPDPIDLADILAEPINPDVEEAVRLEELQDRLNSLPAWAGAGHECDGGEVHIS